MPCRTPCCGRGGDWPVPRAEHPARLALRGRHPHLPGPGRRAAARGLPVDLGPAGTHRDRRRAAVESRGSSPIPTRPSPAAAAGPAARDEQRETVELGVRRRPPASAAAQRAVLILRECSASPPPRSPSAGHLIASVKQRPLSGRADVSTSRSPDPYPAADPAHARRRAPDGIVTGYSTGACPQRRRCARRPATGAAPGDAAAAAAGTAASTTVTGSAGGCPLTACAAGGTLETGANGQPALAAYNELGSSGRYAAHGVTVLTLEGPPDRRDHAFALAPLLGDSGCPATSEARFGRAPKHPRPVWYGGGSRPPTGRGRHV